VAYLHQKNIKKRMEEPPGQRNFKNRKEGTGRDTEKCIGRERRYWDAILTGVGIEEGGEGPGWNTGNFGSRKESTGRDTESF
jgi:hypothetical protein